MAKPLRGDAKYYLSIISILYVKFTVKVVDRVIMDGKGLKIQSSAESWVVSKCIANPG